MTSKYAKILIVLILVVTFSLDAIMPLGYELWVGHVFAVLLTLWIEQPRAPYMIAVVTTALLGLEFMLSPAGIPIDMAVFNRAVGIALLWIMAVLVRRAKAAKLDESTRQLGAIVDGSNDAILALTPDGRVTSWNAGAVHTFGFSAAEMVGRSIQMLIPAHLHRDEVHLRTQVQEGSQSHTYDTVRMTKDGRHLDVSVTLSPLKDMSGQIMGTSKIIRDISERKRAQVLLQQALDQLEMKVQERTVELSSANNSLRELSGRLMQVQEEERSRLARDLHDEVGQLLTALKIDLQGLQHGDAGQNHPGSLTDSLELVDRLLTQVRNLALDLRPSLLDDVGLVAALRWYTNRQAERNGWALSFSVEGMAGRMPVPIEIACFRIVQEALTNVAKHSRAKTLSLALRRRDQDVALAIQDDGVGFDVQSARQRAQGGESIGLLGMEERVRLAGGRLMISSALGQGCRLELHFPLAGHDRPKLHDTVEVVPS